MHKGIAVLVGFLIPAAVLACDESAPVCVTQAYMQAHIEKDPGTLYALTDDSQRGDKREFLASYHDEHLVPRVFQDYWENQATFEASLIDEADDFARVRVVSHYPDWAGVARQRAVEEDALLITSDDWQQLVEALLNEDVDQVRAEAEFYLVRTENEWRILRPTLH